MSQVSRQRVIKVCRQLCCLQTCTTYWINSWWWTDELSETCRFSWQNKFVKLVHLVGFITNKFITMHGHMNVKKNRSRTRQWAANGEIVFRFPATSRGFSSFKKYSYWVWSPPSLLFSGYQGSILREVSDLGLKLTTELHLTSRLRISAVTPLVLYRKVCYNLQHTSNHVRLLHVMNWMRRKKSCFSCFGMMSSNILRPRKHLSPHLL